jgi:hypothetical protein
VTVIQDAAAPDVVCFKRKLEDLEFREREFTLEQKQKLAAVELDKKQKLAAVELQECQIELDKKKKLAEIEVQQKHEYSDKKCQIDLEKEKKFTEIEVQQKKKYAPQYGQLALQERDIELQQKKIALRERDTEIRERNLAIQEKQIKLQNKAPVGGAPKLPHPPSKEKAPAAGSSMKTMKPPPLAKDKPPPLTQNKGTTKNSPTAVIHKQPSSHAKENARPTRGGGHKQPSTAPITQFFMPGIAYLYVFLY